MKSIEDLIEEEIRSRIDQGKDINKHAKAFDDWDKDTRIRFYDAIRFEDIGEPILMFLGRNQSWLIFGSKGLISGTENTLNSLEYRKLEKYDFGYIDKEDPLKTLYRKLMTFGRSPSSVLIKEKGKPTFVVSGLRFNEVCSVVIILEKLKRIIKNNTSS